VIALLLLGCAAGDGGASGAFPRLLFRPEHRELILSRLDRAPYDMLLEGIEETAAGDYEEDGDPDIWDHDANGHNAEVAQANALLAWLLDDEAAGQKALDFLDRLESDYETHQTWDINIRMPHTLMGYGGALDLLCGAGQISEAQRLDAEEKLGHINEAFFDEYVLDDVTRAITLGFSQNNHPIRTAAAIGFTALVVPDHPDAEAWLDWAVSEEDYLWGPDGQYVQADGGISEGPHYYAFAYSAAVAFFIAMENGTDPAREYHRDCINRQDVDPWAGHGCVDGEAFTFANPLHEPLFHATVDWSISLRLPSGLRPPLADSYLTRFNGGPLLTAFGGGGHTTWDWANNTERPYDTSKGLDLAPYFLAYLDDGVAAEEPGWRSRFLPAAGNAVFRSGWDTEARWLLLVAEAGSARKTLHDHVDGTSFSLAAYGEYLLMDAGYYKPNDLDNAVTADADSHNVILVDGQGAPDKGLLTDFGDADATLENTRDGERLAWAEAHQEYEEVQIERGVAFVDGRYFLVVDRLESAVSDPRTFTWRLHGWAGEDEGGVFELREDGALWERTAAGVAVSLASTASGLAVEAPPREDYEAPHVHEIDLERNVLHHGVMDASVSAQAPGFLAVLAPYRVGDSGADGPLAVRALDAGADAAAWRIESSEGVDVAWLRGPSAAGTLSVDGVTLETDGEFALARLDGTLGMVLRGEAVSLDGAPLAESGGAPAGFSE
jgi:hypothetical protein